LGGDVFGAKAGRIYCDEGRIVIAIQVRIIHGRGWPDWLCLQKKESREKNLV